MRRKPIRAQQAASTRLPAALAVGGALRIRSRARGPEAAGSIEAIVQPRRVLGPREFALQLSRTGLRALKVELVHVGRGLTDTLASQAVAIPIRQEIPGQALGRVDRHALPVEVHHAYGVHGRCIAQLGGLPVEAQGPGIVHAHSVAVHIAERQVAESAGVGRCASGTFRCSFGFGTGESGLSRPIREVE